ncbi:p28-like protein [Fowlpox virus]|nr:p28-like protein [Fowlpox virus]
MDFRYVPKRRINDFFSVIQYGEFELLMIDSNNYINVSQLCNYNNKDFKIWMGTGVYAELINELDKSKTDRAIILIDKYGCDINGYYAHPSLVPIIASWASPTFAIKASKIVNYYMMNNYSFVTGDSTNCYMEMMAELNDRRLKEVRDLKNHYREQKRELNYQNKLLRSKISDLENKNGNMRTKINNFNTATKEIKDENNSVKNKIKITERLYVETIRENTKLNNLLTDLEKENESLKNDMIELRNKVAKEITELYDYTMRNTNNNPIESDDLYLMDRCFKRRSRADKIVKKHSLVIMQEKKNLLNFRYMHIHIRKLCLEFYRYEDRDLLFYTCYEISLNAIRRFKEFLESNNNLKVTGCKFSIIGNTYTILDLRKDINALCSDNRG